MEQVPQAVTSKEGPVWSFGLVTVPDTCRRFMYQKGSQAFGDSGLGLATLWLCALHCFTLLIKGSLEGRGGAGWMSCLPSLHFREPICSPPGLGEAGEGAVHLGGSDQKKWPPLPCDLLYTTGHCILPTYCYSGCQSKHLFLEGTKS